ncbi:hypothetical protein K474DRAFT_1703260 [Panus rudis PR-1116 ss-1]|nr:hypothetical protein K474DRAFT_1703260 [Panus rudis PR-1116 ss-1]
MLHILDLPVELLTKILNELDFRNLLRCKRVCRQLQVIIEDAIVLRYKVELAINGLEDGPPSSLGASDRLNLLHQREEAWDRLAYKTMKDVEMHRGEVWELYGGVLAQGQGQRSLHFYRLPSEIRGIEEEHWKLDLEFAIRDFGMDPTQDLLVVIERPALPNTSYYPVHLLSLRTGKPHPLAPKPAILSHTPRFQTLNFTIQTCSHHVAVLYHSQVDNGGELLVWNWKTGDVVMAISGSTVMSFAFLSEHHLLLVRVQTANVALVAVDLRTARTEMTSSDDMDFVCSFNLPSFKPDRVVVDAMIRSDPAPSWKPSDDLQVPFYTARKERLLVVPICVVQDHNTISMFMLLTLSSVLLNHISETEQARREVAWDDWGPSGSRVMSVPPGLSQIWVCYVYGTSILFPSRFMHGSERYELNVLDFNQDAFRWHLAQFAEDPEEYDKRNPAKLMNQPMSMGSNGMLFGEAVLTNLPFRLTRTELPVQDRRLQAAMISEDSVVLVTTENNIRRYRILTF